MPDLPIDASEQIAASQQFLRTLSAQAAAFLPNLFVAALIVVAGIVIAGWLARLFSAGLTRTGHIDETVRQPLVSILRYGVIILTLIAALGQVGVQMTSLLAVLGAAGLAVGLALQGTLTNIASGIMLLWLRPFRVGDYVETSAIAGTVREIGLFTCHLETYDGIFVFAPNSTLWNVWLRNHTRAASRLVAWQVVLPRTVSFEEARALLAEWPEEAGLDQPVAFLDQLGADSQTIVFRAKVTEGSTTLAQRATAERIRERFVQRFGTQGEPRTIQRLVPGDGDPSRYLGPNAAPAVDPASPRAARPATI